MHILPGDTFQHLRTQGVYRVVTAEARSTDKPSPVPVVVYRNVTSGECWVRPLAEFTDGRFRRAPELD